MNLIIDICIVSKNNSRKLLRKEFTINSILPYKGLEIEDTAWKNPKEILNVTYNPTDDYVYINLEDDKISDEADINSHIEMYKLHSWKILN